MPGGQAVFTNKSSISDASQLSYQWNFGDGGTSTAVNASHAYATIQAYRVNLKATSAFGCFDDTTKVLPASAFSQGPIVDFQMSDNKVCEAAIVNFTDKSSSTASITGWDWTFGDGTKSAVQNPTKTYSKFGTYQVTLRVTDKDGCVAVSAPGKSVEVLINPQIDAGPDIFTDENTSVVLKATATNAQQLKFLWQPAGLLSDPTLLQPTYVARQDQVFVLTATDLQGLCSAQDQMKVVVRKKVFVPNAFSPNGDGINDVWVIRNLSDYPQSSVYVFDRYGRQVFSSQGYSTPWDGTVNGRPVPAGTYYYVIHIKQGEPPLTGSVTVLR
jgi:gliding motility-associated-like protein